MKDKRQRVSMNWPYDPTIYAYLVNAAAASLQKQQQQQQPHPYAINAHSSGPFSAYYASMGLQCAASAAFSHPGLPPASALDFLQRSTPNLFESTPNNTRIPLLPPLHGCQANPSVPIISTNRELPLNILMDDNLSADGHVVGERCSSGTFCRPLLFGRATSSKSGVYSPEGAAGKTLFQPFKADVERV
jgi:hypothetical protein